MSVSNFNIKGLTEDQVVLSREKYGFNSIDYKTENRFLEVLRNLIKEPMVILLLVASAIYFITGNVGDGIFLSVSVVLVSAISIYQDSRSRIALDNLKKITEPTCTVIRNGEVVEIKTQEIVVGDSLMVEEGTTISADGVIVHANDFSVSEALLTGESLSVYKDQTKEDNCIYQGTVVVSGLAIATVNAIGKDTCLGKIGKSIESIEEEKTPLELQINNFVRKMVIIGAVVFGIVWVINYLESNSFLDSLLQALTLAMSILPEEIPVAFTTFMALGAWRLMKMGIVVKHMKTVETLGGATVICLDKTGTITENRMQLAKLFVPPSKSPTNPSETLSKEERELVNISMWASEPIPFDPMEVALHDAYAKLFPVDERPNYKMIHEYPLDGKPPMMTHIFEDASGNRIVASKGAPEALMKVSDLTKDEIKSINEVIKSLASDGFRVLGVGKAIFEGDNFPATQQELKFHFKGIIGFYDPPKENIKSVLKSFYEAGINLKVVTGDYAATTSAIAKQVGLKGYEQSMSGEDLMNLSTIELEERVMSTQVFTRMFPDAKLKIINALKARNEIVAMTGDGVNDGPALKASHIGIAMGKRGTELAKQAASLILTEDDFSKMVDAVAMGRRIYANLKKAIQYIISIHIPIIFTVFIPLALGWVYPNIFSPVHVILLELIMGPTCSIIYENEPMEKNTMLQKPRPFSTTFFIWKELITSVIQGLMITIGSLVTYQYAVNHGFNEEITRTMVFTVLLTANIFLTLVNRSFYYSIFTTLRYRNNFVPLIIITTIAISGLLLFVKPLTAFFEFETLNLFQLTFSVCIGFLSVIWYEGVKVWKRSRQSALK